MIDNIVREAKVGEIYEGEVTRVEEYGAFVNLFGTTDGLCHVSRLDWNYVEDATKFVKLGDKLKVVVIGLEEGKIKLSHREFLEKPEGYVERPERKPGNDRPRGGKDFRGGHGKGGNRH
jgi:polyribonucleotide nucleotidyltransferase